MSFFSKDHNETLLLRVERVLHSKLQLAAGSSVIVGVSGGPDSVALLHLLASSTLALTLHAIYVDHKLRPQETPAEVKLVTELCRSHTVPLTIETVDVPAFHIQTGYSPEEAARILRYRALEYHRMRLGARYIAVAHNADDQVEEFFLRLGRGTGLTGLSGMQFMSGNLIRPLLQFYKHELISYLKAQNISYCLDSSNLDRKYLRNKVRLDVIPLLENTFLPGIRDKVVQTMEILRTDDDFINTIVRQKMLECVRTLSQGNSILPSSAGLFIDLQELRNCHPAIQRRIIEQCCVQIHSKPGYTFIVQILKKMEQGQLSKEYHLPQGGRLLPVTGGLFFCHPQLDSLRAKLPEAPVICRLIEKPGIYCIEEAGMQLTLAVEDASEESDISPTPESLQVDLDTLDFPLTLRSFQPGDRITPVNSSGSKKVGRYLNEKKIPAREKNLWPVLVSDSSAKPNILAIVGLTIDEMHKISDHTSKILTIRWEPMTTDAP